MSSPHLEQERAPSVSAENSRCALFQILVCTAGECGFRWPASLFELSSLPSPPVQQCAVRFPSVCPPFAKHTANSCSIRAAGRSSSALQTPGAGEVPRFVSARTQPMASGAR